MQKRGQLQIPKRSLLGLVVAGIVVIMILLLVQAAGKSQTLARDYIAKDLALLVDTAYAANGDLDYTYKIPERFKITIKDNVVNVKDSNGLESAHYFASNNQIVSTWMETDTAPKAVRIIKTSQTIRFTPVYDHNENLAIQSFTEFVAFLNANKGAKYPENCKEQFDLKLSKGFYVFVSKDTATLFYESPEGTMQEASGQIPSYSFYQSMLKSDFYISPSDWKPQIAALQWIPPTVLMVKAPVGWNFAKPSIEVNEMKPCVEEKA